MQTIQGRIVKFLPKQEGESSRGHWVKAGVVIEYGDEYPKKAAFSIFGEERLLMCAGLSQGMEVKINYNPESREYQDRWYTDLNCIGISAVVNQDVITHQQVQQTQVHEQKYVQQQSTLKEDDSLPF